MELATTSERELVNKGVLEALDLIQTAQTAIDYAARKLCSLEGYCDDWTRLNRLREKINAEWHRLAQHRAAAMTRKGGR